MSLRPLDWQDLTRSGKMRFPRLSRTDVGSNSLISLEKAESLLDGSREVVTYFPFVSSNTI